VSFLDTVQWAGVDLLSISWQLGLGRVGQGGTADIFQSLVDVNTTMTFKRWSKDLTESDTQHVYEKASAEIISLSRPTVQKHRNIIKLVGVCWDIDREQQTVYPALVSEKSTNGDMVTFLGSDRGRSMTLQEQLGFCLQVAEALCVLHSSGTYSRYNALIQALRSYVTQNSSIRYCPRRRQASQHSDI
jgi:hypothetical protein